METGVWIEYFINPGDLFQFSIGGITGVGMYGFFINEQLVGGPAFLLNPEFLWTLFTTDFLHIGAGFGYRFVLGSSLPGITDTQLWGVTGSIQIRSGGF